LHHPEVPKRSRKQERFYDQETQNGKKKVNAHDLACKPQVLVVSRGGGYRDVGLQFAYCGAAPTKEQPFFVIVPLRGQKQVSIGATWQSAVTEWPVLSVAVHFVQLEVIRALAGTISNAALRSVAATLASKSIFLFISKIPSGCPMEWAVVNGPL
jgi:hypothetical protein